MTQPPGNDQSLPPDPFNTGYRTGGADPHGTAHGSGAYAAGAYGGQPYGQPYDEAYGAYPGGASYPPGGVYPAGTSYPGASPYGQGYDPYGDPYGAYGAPGGHGAGANPYGSPGAYPAGGYPADPYGAAGYPAAGYGPGPYAGYPHSGGPYGAQPYGASSYGANPYMGVAQRRPGAVTASSVLAFILASFNLIAGIAMLSIVTDRWMWDYYDSAWHDGIIIMSIAALALGAGLITGGVLALRGRIGWNLACGSANAVLSIVWMFAASAVPLHDWGAATGIRVYAVMFLALSVLVATLVMGTAAQEWRDRQQ